MLGSLVMSNDIEQGDKKLGQLKKNAPININWKQEKFVFIVVVKKVFILVVLVWEPEVHGEEVYCPQMAFNNGLNIWKESV